MPTLCDNYHRALAERRLNQRNPIKRLVMGAPACGTCPILRVSAFAPLGLCVYLCEKLRLESYLRCRPLVTKFFWEDSTSRHFYTWNGIILHYASFFLTRNVLVLSVPLRSGSWGSNLRTELIRSKIASHESWKLVPCSDVKCSALYTTLWVEKINFIFLQFIFFYINWSRFKWWTPR